MKHFIINNYFLNLILEQFSNVVVNYFCKNNLKSHIFTSFS